jgi:hypothetical protein
MARVLDATSPNFFGKPSAKRPKRSPAKAAKRYHTIFFEYDACVFIAEIWKLKIMYINMY